MPDRTTDELLDRLRDDLNECAQGMDHARSIRDAAKVPSKPGQKDFPPGSAELFHREYEYHARTFFRTVFAFIEAVIFTLKTSAAAYCVANNIPLSTGELDFAAERDYKLTGTGTVIEQYAHIRLTDNIRFTMALIEKAHGIPPTFNANVGWWSDLQSSSRVRDRLTHPKRPEDLDITDGEIDVLKRANTGLLDHFMSYPNLYFATARPTGA